MLAAIKRYTRWLHTAWPAGVVEKLPEVREDGTTNVPGIFVTGDLTGIPLLKFAADGGARAVQVIAADPAVKADVESPDGRHVHDLVIVGGGVSGMAAAVEAKKRGLDFVALEATEPFSTIVNFPRRKPIFTYPTDMTPAGDLRPSAQIKEELVDELRAQSIDLGIVPRAARAERVARKGKLFEVLLRDEEGLLAKRVIIAIGRSGNFRKLGIPGQDRDKVFNRLHDPKDFCAQDVLIVGGGDSAMETAIALAQCGSRVTLSYRKPEFSRPKPENVERLNALIDDPLADVAIEQPSSERVTTSAGPFLGENRKAGSVRLMMSSNPKSIGEQDVTVVDSDGREQTFANDAVFAMIGREPPLDFFRRSGVRIRGEWTRSTWAGFIGFAAFCFLLYNWKSGGAMTGWFQERGWFPFNMPGMLAGLSAAAERPAHLLGTLSISMGEPSFYYSLAYCLAIVIFGFGRSRRRRTPYVKAQTLTLMVIQVIPLFLLPLILLPWVGHNGWFEAGFGRTLADALFPVTEWSDHGREYWRSIEVGS